MGWDGPILTDSGGFQVFSLADRMKVDESGVGFARTSTARRSSCRPNGPSPFKSNSAATSRWCSIMSWRCRNARDVVADAMRRSVRWAERCQAAATRDDQTQFAIVQGGLDARAAGRIRRETCRDGFPRLCDRRPERRRAASRNVRGARRDGPLLPRDRPRYLMGVGRPIDLLEAISRGVDLFDCVMPTRNGRNALAFTDAGQVRLRNQQHSTGSRAARSGVPCLACRHSRGYLRHLFQAGEMLGPMLVSMHNLTYYQKVVAEARRAIAEDRFASLVEERRRGRG